MGVETFNFDTWDKVSVNFLSLLSYCFFSLSKNVHFHYLNDIISLAQVVY